MLYLILAAIFNAMMDTLTHHFDTSVFKGLNPKWWNPNVSWQYNNNFLGIVRLDAWHLAKFGMIGSICMAMISYHQILGNFSIFVLPIIWSVTFETFYKLLRKP